MAEQKNTKQAVLKEILACKSCAWRSRDEVGTFAMAPVCPDCGDYLVFRMVAIGEFAYLREEDRLPSPIYPPPQGKNK